MTTQQNEREELPPLPDPVDAVLVGWRNQTKMLIPRDDYYTADQMREYARAALLQADAKVGWEVVAVHDKDQPNGIAWCPGNPEALADITALYTRPQQAAQVAQPLTCEWSLTDDDAGVYSSACGEMWVFNDGGPKENSVRFCQGCGQPVQCHGITGKDKE